MPKIQIRSLLSKEKIKDFTGKVKSALSQLRTPGFVKEKIKSLVDRSKTIPDKRRILIPVALMLVVITVSSFYIFRRGVEGTLGSIQASGTVEATEIIVSPELGGSISQVFVREGDLVAEGDPLFELDDELLSAQRERAAAALASAQAGYTNAMAGGEMARVGLRKAEINQQTVKAKSEADLIEAQNALDALYDNHEVARAEAFRAVAAANRAVREAQYQLNNFTIPVGQENYTAFEAVKVMKEKLDKASQAFEPYRYASLFETTREDLKDQVDTAQSDYDSAVKRMEYETELDSAQARLDKAIEDYEILKDGPDPDDVTVLESRISVIELTIQQAGVAVDEARVAVAQADAKLKQARAAVSLSQAELDYIDVQLKKMTVTAPAAGVVMTKSVEPGEVVQPGTTAMTLGELDSLTITVYVPEDRYGEIRLGMSGRVTVDSFPSKSFKATVTRISEQAEFTPRNVQTEEGRRTTVFAIELSVSNPQGLLKPGMPADVEFR